MPVLIIAVVSLVLFLIMGAMCISAVLSERRFERQVEDYKTAMPVVPAGNEVASAKGAGVGR